MWTGTSRYTEKERLRQRAKTLHRCPEKTLEKIAATGFPGNEKNSDAEHRGQGKVCYREAIVGIVRPRGAGSAQENRSEEQGPRQDLHWDHRVEKWARNY